MSRGGPDGGQRTPSGPFSQTWVAFPPPDCKSGGIALVGADAERCDSSATHLTHENLMPQVFCRGCAKPIPEERLEILPDTTLCVKCAAKGPQVRQHDPELVCAKASPSGQNGWSPTS